MNAAELQLSIRKYEAFVRREVLPISAIVYKDDTYQPLPERPGHFDRQRVQALYNDFEANGCKRQEHPVLVHSINSKFVCLDGKCRLEAGRMYLKEDDQSWPGLIFDTSDPVLLNYLRSSHAVLEPYSDGDIYRIASYYQALGNDILADVWKKKLTKGKRRHIKSLENAAVSGEASLADHLKKLLPYPSLWSTYKMSIHHIETMRCQEEMAHYLNLILEFWLEASGSGPLSATIAIVQKLEGKYPELSTEDAECIATAFEDYTIFEKVQGISKREEVRLRCLNYGGRILSLTTFVEDTKLLSLSSEAMKSLLPKTSKKSIKVLLRDRFNGNDPGSDGVDQFFENGYRQLWLFAWQNFPELVTSRQLYLRRSHRQDGFQKSPIKVANFQTLAKQLGFSNANINSESSATESMPRLSQAIESFLRGFSKDRTFQRVHMKAAVAAISGHVEAFLGTTQPMIVEKPSLTQSRLQPRTGYRAGLPEEASFVDDRASLSMHHVYGKWGTEIAGRRYASTFGILRDQFRCFFGRHAISAFTHEELASATPTSNHTPHSSALTDSSEEVFWNACEHLNGKRHR